MTNEPAVTVSIRDLTIRLPAGADREYAVSAMNVDVPAGKITCIVGESGSGKSLAARAIMQLLPPGVSVERGSVHFGSVNLIDLDPSAIRKLRGNRIAMIFQDPMTALNPLQTIGKQLQEVFVLHTSLSRDERKQRAIALLESVNLPDPSRMMDSYPHQLSGGQRQRAMIAMALALEPDLVIADEPTTALDVTTQAQILRLLADLQRTRKTGILFITHDFGVVAEIADEVVVMQHGEVVEQGSAGTVLGNPQHPYTRALIAAAPKLTSPPVRPAPKNRPLVVGSGIHKTYESRRLFGQSRAVHALTEVDIVLNEGETLGLVGESGSGKSTLARVVTRLTEASGSLEIAGRETLHLNRKQLKPIRKDMQMVFQDPYASLDPRFKVVDIVAEGPIIHGTPRDAAHERARELLSLVGLSPAAADRYPHEFSGGQRQRIGIARALALDPKILVADEPVSALDVSVQSKVLALLADIRQKFGLAMLFVTHDLRIALQICDRIAVMRQGRIVEIGTAQQIYSDPQHPYTRALFAAIPGGQHQLGNIHA